MTLLELVAKITLDSKEYKNGLKKLKRETNEKANGIKKGMLTATGVMAGALAAVGISAVKTGAEFDKAMSQVAATMGTTTDEIQNLRDFAKEMGSTTQFSATQAAEALNYMALAGYDAEKSMRMLPNVLNLASAGAMDLATASDMVTDASSALGLTEEETTALIDKMAKAASKSNTSVSQLGEAMLTIGGTAKSLKGGTTELSAALGILADNGIKGAEGGTALRNVLLGIQGDKFEKTFGELGVSAYDAQGNLRPLKDILADMDSVMEGMTSQEKTQLINKTFNRQDLKTVNALLGTTADRWDELTTSIDKAKGAAQEMADTQLDNLAGDVTKLKSAWEGFQINLSENINPALRVATQLLTTLIENMDVAGPIILGVATAFTVLAVAVNMKKIIDSVTTSFAALNTVLAANPIGIVIALIAGLVIAIATLWASNEDFRNFVTETWEKIKEVFATVCEAIGGFFEDAWNKIVEIFSGIGDWFAEKWQAIKDVFSGVGDWFKEKFTKAKENSVDAWKDVKEKFSEKWSKIKEAFGKVGDWFKERFSTAKNNSVSAWDDAKSKFKNVWKKIKEAFKFKDAFKWGKDMIQNFIDGVKSMFGKLGDAVSGAASKVAEFLHFSEPEKGPLSDFHSFAPDMMDLFMKGIKDNQKKLQDTVASAFDFKDTIVQGDIDINGNIKGTSTTAPGSTSIVINVQGAPGQDVNELANIISKKLDNALRREQEAWA